jgi:hypothetical protein
VPKLVHCWKSAFENAIRFQAIANTNTRKNMALQTRPAHRADVRPPPGEVSNSRTKADRRSLTDIELSQLDTT